MLFSFSEEFPKQEFNVAQWTDLSFSLLLILRVDFDGPHPLEVLRGPVREIPLKGAGLDELLKSAGLCERKRQIRDRRPVD